MDALPKLDPEPIQTLADGIKRIADSMEAMRKMPLKRHTLLVLLREKTGLGLRDINAVLESLDSLAKDWLS